MHLKHLLVAASLASVCAAPGFCHSNAQAWGGGSEVPDALRLHPPVLGDSDQIEALHFIEWKAIMHGYRITGKVSGYMESDFQPAAYVATATSYPGTAWMDIDGVTTSFQFPWRFDDVVPSDKRYILRLTHYCEEYSYTSWKSAIEYYYRDSKPGLVVSAFGRHTAAPGVDVVRDTKALPAEMVPAPWLDLPKLQPIFMPPETIAIIGATKMDVKSSDLLRPLALRPAVFSKLQSVQLFEAEPQSRYYGSKSFDYIHLGELPAMGMVAIPLSDIGLLDAVCDFDRDTISFQDVTCEKYRYEEYMYAYVPQSVLDRDYEGKPEVYKAKMLASNVELNPHPAKTVAGPYLTYKGADTCVVVTAQ